MEDNTFPFLLSMSDAGNAHSLPANAAGSEMPVLPDAASATSADLQVGPDISADVPEEDVHVWSVPGDVSLPRWDEVNVEAAAPVAGPPPRSDLIGSYEPPVTPDIELPARDERAPNTSDKLYRALKLDLVGSSFSATVDAHSSERSPLLSPQPAIEAPTSHVDSAPAAHIPSLPSVLLAEDDCQ